MQHKKNKIYEKFKNSYFGVNKIYLFIIFISLSIQDFTLGFIYFLISLIVFARKTLKAKLPIETNEDFKMKTYIYKKTKDIDLKLDLWYPNNIPRNNLPLIYFCHGGGWISGFRNQPNNISWCKYLADKGFAVSSIDYRYGYKNSMTDILSDYIDGLEYLRKNHTDLGLNKNNITLVGLSAGGHLSLLFSTYFTSIKDSEMMNGIRSVVGYYSPTDLREITIEEDNKSFFASYAIKRTLKNTPNAVDNEYTYYSPISYLSKGMIPTLLVHGEKDNTVPISSSKEFAKHLKELNVPCEFLTHSNADHSFDTVLNDYTTVNILEKTARFIKKYSK